MKEKKPKVKMEERKSHGVQLLIRAVVKDPDGKVLSDTGRKPSKSFVIQFLEFIYPLFDGAAPSYAATATDGTEDDIYSSAIQAYKNFLINAPINDDDYGIVVGTGDTAVTNTDFKLETQLTEGVGVGNIIHGAQVITVPGVVGANVDLETERPFTNNTGSSITIKEAGLYTNISDAYFHCIIRDVLALPVNLPDKCSLTVYYTLRTTV